MRNPIVLCAAFALLSAHAHAGTKADKPPATLAEPDRSVAGGRAVRLNLAQTRIETTIEIGRIPEPANGGGLLGYLIIKGMDDRRDTMGRALRDRAEAVAEPLWQALRGFDVDGLALAATRTALAKPAWFQPLEISKSKTRSADELASFLASAEVPQSAFINYRYELSPDFSQIRVFAEITVAKRMEAKGKKTAPAPQIIYRQQLGSVVQLRTRSYEPEQNVARWSAENGKLARQALTAAFGQFETLIPYALGLSQADLNGINAKNREKSFAAGFCGPLIARSAADPEDVLIWSDGFVHVQAAP